MSPAAVQPVLDVALEPKRETAELAQTDPVLAMIERLAVNQNFDVEKLQRLIDMQKDIAAVNARSAFNIAFAKMQAELPTVMESGKTDKGTYATLEDIVEAVRPVLSAHGFSLSHRTEWPDKSTVKVIGILTHADGHARESEFMAAADTSGSKNAIQALASSVSYGRRYTTKDLLNIVTRFEDDDGEKSDAKRPAAPNGYDQWLTDMQSLVDGGCDWPTLEKAWDDSKEIFRKHISTHNRAKVEAWKKAAKAVPRA